LAKWIYDSFGKKFGGKLMYNHVVMYCMCMLCDVLYTSASNIIHTSLTTRSIAEWWAEIAFSMVYVHHVYKAIWDPVECEIGNPHHLLSTAMMKTHHEEDNIHLKLSLIKFSHKSTMALPHINDYINVVLMSQLLLQFRS